MIGQDSISGLGVAVSGGGDSLALMLCAAAWARARGTPFRAVTVDHRLRPEAAQEAATVARVAADHGIAHDTVEWHGWDGSGNVQDNARRARFALISVWAHRNEISHVCLGHTADDQAETVLMRLARGAGVDGLSAIPPRRVVEGVAFLRPMLDIARDDLRAWLTAQGQAWIDDPSNENTRFDRIKARRALDHLAPLGLDRDSLITVSRNMAEARKALKWQTYLAARELAQMQAGDVLIARPGFRTLPQDIQRRLIAQALCWISGAAYPPRRRPLLEMVQAALQGRGMTLHGCQMLPDGPDQPIRLTREYNAVARLRCAVTQTWDGRWRFVGQATQAPLQIAALGEAGLAQCPDWRESGLPHASMLGCPALWDGDTVVAAPLACRPECWRQVLARNEEDFFAALMKG
nr:tRNA lysidine(34) synthetase TilS [Lutimaribacter sp. EGI FJ00013]